MAPATVAKALNTVLWLGADERRWGVVYKANGLSPVPVSNYAIENKIKFSGSTATAQAFTHQDQGHTFYVLNLPGIGTALCYDLNTDCWHERGFYTGGGNLGLPLPYCATSVQQSPVPTTVKNLAGDPSGNIYQWGTEYASDNGTPILRIRAAPHIRSSNRWVK